MRIIGGKYRGKNLISPTSTQVRPTSDKARQALFNILRSRLGNDFSNLKLIDVFSGSGAFALEALSQGFNMVTLLDIDTTDLQKNIALFSSEKNKIRILKQSAITTWLDNEHYDVLFMDAPYKRNLTEPALEQAVARLNKGALCLIEVEKSENCALPPNFKLLDERRYGLAKIIISEFIG